MSDQIKNARSIFIDAVENVAREGWPEFLEKTCGDDKALRGQVERLLNAHEDIGSFMGRPAGNASPTVDQPVTEKPGTQIGPFKLLQQLGEGGMGVVYMAEQHEPVRRKVALKIIKPGMDTRQVIARFEAEEQALSLMDHPNIARVIDAGMTDSGRPYFVMELVKGQPIIEYCDQHQLTPRERLELFLPVCQAIQHAHQKGIIHRDIKPSNILVAEYDQQPVPKVIDFGVAKAISQPLTEKTMFTALGQIVGTLEYMSPEQAKVNQLDIDTRTDVYALGVLLYELLTGTTPFDRERFRSAAWDEMLRIIREEEPPKPSSRLTDSTDSLPSISAHRHTEPAKLTKLVRGELDWIVMKALEKDRSRRYDTASKFAEDVQHYLNDEAVVACPPSATYRFRKFARRNKPVIATTTAIAAALIVGIIGTTWQAIRVTQERDRAVVAEGRAEAEAENARTEAAIAKAVNDFLQEDLLGMADAASQVSAEITPDPDVKLRTVLDRAAEKIEGRFSEQPLVEAAIRNTIGNTYRSLGAYDQSEKHHRRALDLRRGVLGTEHADTLGSMNNLAVSYDKQGRYKEAEGLHRETLEALRRMLGDEDPDTLRSMNNLAGAYMGQGRHDEAERLHRETLEARRRTLGDEHPATLASMNNLAGAYMRQGRPDEAERLHREILEARRRTLGDEHPSTLSSMNNLAVVYHGRGRYKEAEGLHRETLEARRRTLGDEHPSTLDSIQNLANAYYYQGRYDEAEGFYRETLEARRRMLGDEHPRTLGSMNNLAVVYADQGRHDEAERLLRETLAAIRRTLGDEHPHTLGSMYNLARALKAKGEEDDALALLEQTADIRKRVLGLDHPRTRKSMKTLAEWPSYKAWNLATAADRERRNPEEALFLAQKAVDLYAAEANHWDNLGVALYRNDRWEEAVEALEKAREMRDGKDPDHQLFLAMAYWRLGQEEHALKNYVDAAAWLAQESRPEEQYRFRDEAETVISVEALIRYCTTGIEANPESDKLLMARASVRARSGQLDQAAEDYAQALPLLPEPASPWWTPIAGSKSPMVESDEIYQRLEVLFPQHRGFRIARVHHLGARRKWEELSAQLEAVIELDPTDHMSWCNAAALALYRADADAYRQIRGELMARFADTDSPWIAEWVASACLWSPEATAQLDVTRQLAEWAVSTGANHRFFHWFHLAKALGDYRGGDFETAIASAKRSRERVHQKSYVHPTALLVQAMAQHQLGRSAKARQSLSDAHDLMQQQMPTADDGALDGRWDCWLRFHVLRREAEALIDPQEDGESEPEESRDDESSNPGDK